ncbi:MAG: chromosome segregation protein SMC [Halobacteriaceae archaeon]
MHIDEIVLENFKSFGQTTRIPFYEDFTTISGPNGAGKSNIIDAILFALGLARSHGMRAEKLTDLIYNPSHNDSNAISGPDEASVTVILDNTDRTFERSQIINAAGSEKIGDIDKIEIKRRVKRTDDNYYSYYYINGRSVNLSDIQDLISQAGVTPEGYNVVMQGDVTGIIKMTAHERREIIDEIAGVAEFDKKKEEAYEELDVVDERINEADLRIDEKQNRVQELEGERETAIKYQELKEEKQEYSSYIDAAELDKKRTKLAETRSQIESTQETLSQLKSELDEKRGKVDRLSENLDELNREIERKGEDEQLTIKSEIEEIKGEISRYKDKIETAEEQIEEAENKRREAFVKIDRKKEEIEELESDIKEIKIEKASIKQEIQDKRRQVQELENEIEEVDDEYEELKTKLESKKSALEEAKEKRNDLQREQDRLLDEARRRSDEIEETQSDLDTARDRIPDLQAKLTDLEDELAKAKENKENIEEVIADLKQKRTERQEKLQSIEDDLQAARDEYAQLEANAAESGDSSFGRAVTTILNADIDGVHGAIAQLGSVDEKYATACETAAGGRMAHVVVADDTVGQNCIEYLKERNAGRATFLPLTEMSSQSLSSVPNHDGVIDYAINLVDFEDQYEPVFSYVLGDTLVVNNLDTARGLMGDYRLVTLSGELVEKSGAMTGGSKSGSRYSFTHSKGKLEQVAERITELEEKRQNLRDEISDLNDRIDDAREKRTEADERVNTVKKDIEQTESELTETKSNVDSLESKLADLKTEREEVDEEMQELEEAISSQNETIQEIENNIASIEQQLADSKIPDLTAQKEEIEEEITTLQESMNDLDNKLNSLQLEREYAEETIEELHEEIDTAKDRKVKHENEIDELQEKIAEAKTKLEAKREKVDELEEELADLKESRSNLKKELQKAKQAAEEKQKEVDKVQGKLESLQETADTLTTEIDRLEEEVGDVSMDEIPDLDEVEAKIESIEDKMDELEPVNMLAIDEYERVKSELDDLKERKETLEAERDEIQERIESYEQQKKDAFLEAYNAIDSHFQRIFERLSDGSGELHLENPEDPFEGGLTMKAQPGDKPIQRLEAMSGGEKSLTALAFIFAIQRHNPAPFYALDEVDAFLDAANANRVGELLDELADDAQFIVVSHRSAMLERSERAIGVTMQDDNVSAVTGINLSGEEVIADD